MGGLSEATTNRATIATAVDRAGTSVSSTTPASHRPPMAAPMTRPASAILAATSSTSSALARQATR